MEATFLQVGEAVDYTPTSARTGGEVVAVDGVGAGVCLTDIAANALGSAQVKGIVRVRKITGAILVGSRIGWDEDGDPLGGTAGTGAATAVLSNADFILGTALYAAASADTTIDVILNNSDRIMSATMTLTAAQVNTLYSAGISILAAPGTHNTIEVLGCQLLYNYAAAFTIGSATNISLQYGTTVHAGGTICTGTRAATGFLDQTADTICKLMPVTFTAAATAIENQPVYLVMAGADTSVGTATTVSVRVTYVVHPTGF